MATFSWKRRLLMKGRPLLGNMPLSIQLQRRICSGKLTCMSFQCLQFYFCWHFWIVQTLAGISLQSLSTLANIQSLGNAKIQGLEKDLKMKGNDYNIALFVFFIPYILFEVPSNIFIKRMAPSAYLSGIMVCWGKQRLSFKRLQWLIFTGLATMGQGLVESFGGLVAMRFLIGLFEAGFFPGCAYLISMYYKRYELQRRFTMFFSASIIAGAIGGLFFQTLPLWTSKTRGF